MCFEKHYSEQTSRSLKTKEYIFKNTQSYAHSYVHTHTHTHFTDSNLPDLSFFPILAI